MSYRIKKYFKWKYILFIILKTKKKEVKFMDIKFDQHFFVARSRPPPGDFTRMMRASPTEYWVRKNSCLCRSLFYIDQLNKF